MALPAPTSHDALLIVDMQNDFMLPGAPLEVRGALDIIPGVNALASRYANVILTQDWHPSGHISFASTHDGKQPFTHTVEASYGLQTLWPEHCIQGSAGAELHADLSIPHAQLLLRKGFRDRVDSYSAFFENDRVTPTGLAGYLRERGLTRLTFVGLAFDFCVGHSATAAARIGFHTTVLPDLTRSVGLPGTVEAMQRDLATAGVQLGTS